DDLRALPSARQIQTLECISNGVGSGLMSNAEWTGVPLRSLIEAAGPRPRVVRVALHGADGFVSTVRMAEAMRPDSIVAYEMDGGGGPHVAAGADHVCAVADRVGAVGGRMDAAGPRFVPAGGSGHRRTRGRAAEHAPRRRSRGRAWVAPGRGHRHGVRALSRV